MGEIADQMLNGEICQFCMEPFEGAVGYPVSCPECKKSEYIAEEPVKKVNCGYCGKRLKASGLKDHIRVKHPETFDVEFEASATFNNLELYKTVQEGKLQIFTSIPGKVMVQYLKMKGEDISQIDDSKTYTLEIELKG